MKRAFTLNIILLVSLNLLIKPLYIFGIDMQVQNVIGPEKYGLYFSLFNFTLLFHILLEFGMSNLIKRDVSAARILAPRYFSGLLSVKIILSVIYILVVIIVGLSIGYDGQAMKIIYYLLGLHITMSLVLFCRALLAGLGAYKTDSLLSVLDKAIMIPVMGYLMFVPGSPAVDLWVFLKVYLMSSCITLVVSAMMVARHLKPLSLRLRFPEAIVFLKKVIPYAFITFLMGIYGRLDAVMLERMLPDGSEQAGIYAAGYRLLDAYLMFALLFANLLLPMISTYLNQKEKMASFFNFVFSMLFAISVLAALGLFTFRQELSDFLYTASDDSWAVTFGILMLTILPVSIGIITGSAILATGNVRRLNLLYLCAVILNIAINLILIPKMQSAGAAIAALSVNVFVASGQLWLWLRIVRHGTASLPWARMAVFTLITWAGFFAAHYLFTTVHWFARFTVSGIALLLLAFLFGLIPWRAGLLKELLKKPLG